MPDYLGKDQRKTKPDDEKEGEDNIQSKQQ